MKKPLAFTACLLGTALLILAGLLAAVHIVGTNDDLYYELQMEAGILETVGVTENNLRALNRILAEALSGESDMLFEPMLMVVNGQNEAPFDVRELMHMQDCVDLFALARRVMVVSAVAGAALVICGFLWIKEKHVFRLAVWLGPAAIVVPLGLLAGWAVLDFNSAFNFFHEILFTNDLWLLNPATDLLIRMCPASMFMSMGVRIAVMALVWTLVLPSVLTVLKKERR